MAAHSPSVRGERECTNWSWEMNGVHVVWRFMYHPVSPPLRPTLIYPLPPTPCPARSSVNFFSFMVIKLVLAQIQFVAVLIVASVVLLPFITGAALLLWWDELLLVRACVQKYKRSTLLRVHVTHTTF